MMFSRIQKCCSVLISGPFHSSMGILFGLWHFLLLKMFFSPLPESCIPCRKSCLEGCSVHHTMEGWLLATPLSLAPPVFWNGVWDQWGPQKLKLRSWTLNLLPRIKPWQCGLHDLANVALKYRAVASTDGEKKEIKHGKWFCPSIQEWYKEVRLCLILFRGHWGKTDKHHLSFSWIPATNSKFPLSRYHFPAMASMKDKEQRHFLGVSKASKQTDQRSHCSVLLGREANKSFTKTCPGNGQPWKPFCIAPGKLQATPEQQDIADKWG